jgi:hypothetical protein
MANWEKREIKLPEDHGWTAREGYNVFVADRGAVRLDFPSDWIVKPGEKSIKFFDREPPDDRCGFEVSYLHLRPIDWSGLPLTELLKGASQGPGVPAITDDQIVRVARQDLELVWAEYQNEDPLEHRTAFHRICLARTANVLIPHPRQKRARIATRPTIQALITGAYWPEDRGMFEAAWDEVLRSLQLGIPISSPMGPSRH